MDFASRATPHGCKLSASSQKENYVLYSFPRCLVLRQTDGRHLRCLALLVLPPLVLVSGFSFLLHESNPQPYWGLWLVLPVVLAPIVYGLIGFLMGALTAWVYNFAARRIGGIQLELRPAVPSPRI